MNFNEFAKILYTYISLDDNTADFTWHLFEHIISETNESILDEYQAQSYRKFYSGARSIGGISKTIMDKLEPACFSSYLDKVCSDEQAYSIVEEFTMI